MSDRLIPKRVRRRATDTQPLAKQLNELRTEIEGLKRRLKALEGERRPLDAIARGKL